MRSMASESRPSTWDPRWRAARLPVLTSSPDTDAFESILAGNRDFAQRTQRREPELFERLGKGQSPEVLWVGCADSRIPETTVCDCKPGEIFVHRNIANIVTTKDVSSNSVLDFSVGSVKVKKIVVCGHTKCGGANASLGDDDLGDSLNTWLAPMRELRRKHAAELDKLGSQDAKANRLAELNVLQSIEAIKHNPTVIKAMKERGLTVHGVIYDVPTGQLHQIDEKKDSAPTHHR